MPRFAYLAVDAQGIEQSGQLDAPDTRQVATLLRRRGLFPTVVSPATASVAPLASAKSPPRGLRRELRLPFSSSISPRERASFTRQLAALLRAGMPLVRGLEVLGRQQKNLSLRHVTTTLADAIKSGDTLSLAMAQHPALFDRLYLNMVKAGEASGALDLVLERLARFQEKSLQLKGKIKAAMIYPFIVMTVALVILVGLLLFVVPKFKQIFAELLKGAPLPPLTQFVLTLSDLVKNHALAFAIACFVTGIAIRIFTRRPTGRLFLDTWIIRLPAFGSLLLKSLVARFARTLGTLLSSGVPILPALLITRDTCDNARLAVAITHVHDQVKAGSSVARPLETTAAFPPMVTSMIDVGEHTGKLPDMLNKVADIYEDEVDTAVAGLSSLIEPILILFLAGVVGTIVIALFLPIIRIVQLLT